MARPSIAAFAQSLRVQGPARLDSRPDEVMPGRMKQVARRRLGAAPAIRAQPTRSGLGAPAFARRLITLPVVPHDTAATQTRASPRSIAPVVYGSEGRASVETIGFIGLGSILNGAFEEWYRTAVQTGRPFMTRIGFIGVG